MSIDWSKAPEGATHYCKPHGMWHKAAYNPFRVWVWMQNAQDWELQPKERTDFWLSQGDLSGHNLLERPKKPLTQAVFDGLPPEYLWAAVGSSAIAHAYTDKPFVAKHSYMWSFYIGRGLIMELEGDYDTTDWQNSLIEREESITDVARSIEAARQVEATLAERQNQYGDFKDVAHLSQGLQSLLSVGNFSDTQQEAIQMICSKLARLACGDADHVDSWHDIAGYATLVVKDLESGK